MIENKYDEICYKNNFLKQVIFRIDFTDIIEEIEENGTLNNELESFITKFLPFEDRKEGLKGGVKIDATTLKPEIQKTHKIYSFQFYNQEQNFFIIIDAISITIICKKYISFEDFKEKIIKTIKCLFNRYSNLKISRIGLRYINEFSFKKNKKFTWLKYFDKKLTTFLKVYQNSDNIIKAINRLEIKDDTYILALQYGLNNPDYPAISKQNLFIVDIDAFCGNIEQDDIDYNIDNLHNSIQDLFENLITNKLRNMLNNDE